MNRLRKNIHRLVIMTKLPGSPYSVVAALIQLALESLCRQAACQRLLRRTGLASVAICSLSSSLISCRKQLDHASAFLEIL